MVCSFARFDNHVFRLLEGLGNWFVIVLNGHKFVRPRWCLCCRQKKTAICVNKEKKKSANTLRRSDLFRMFAINREFLATMKMTVDAEARAAAGQMAACCVELSTHTLYSYIYVCVCVKILFFDLDIV